LTHKQRLTVTLGAQPVAGLLMWAHDNFKAPVFKDFKVIPIEESCLYLLEVIRVTAFAS
jgi:hypothetical protein